MLQSESGQSLALPAQRSLVRYGGGPPQEMVPQLSTRSLPSPDRPSPVPDLPATIQARTPREQAQYEIGPTQRMSWTGKDQPDGPRRSRLADMGLGALMGLTNGGGILGVVGGAAAGATGQLYRQGMDADYARRQGEIEHEQGYEQHQRLGEAQIASAIAQEAERRAQAGLHGVQAWEWSTRPSLTVRGQDLDHSRGIHKTETDAATDRYKADIGVLNPNPGSGVVYDQSRGALIDKNTGQVVLPAGLPAARDTSSSGKPQSAAEEEAAYRERLGTLLDRTPIQGMSQDRQTGQWQHSTADLDQQIAGLEAKLAETGETAPAEADIDAMIAKYMQGGSDPLTFQRREILRQIRTLMAQRTQRVQMWNQLSGQASREAMAGKGVYTLPPPPPIDQ
jgi:hypothetical protein